MTTTPEQAVTSADPFDELLADHPEEPYEGEEFTCEGCGHTLPVSYSLRSPSYCYLCDPAISLAEVLSDAPINR